MYKIGIDVGSTYTKYCVMENNNIIELFTEKTPIHQKKYFDDKVSFFKSKYINPLFISCGYGKNNVDSIKTVNELTALAKGANYVFKDSNVVLDIGGQDTKVITNENGVLKDFFINDRCAAGSGMFFENSCSLLGIKPDSLNLDSEPNIKISSLCAVFAQSEITQLIANNIPESEIIKAVIWQTITKTKPLVDKTRSDVVLISGGFSTIKGIGKYFNAILNRDCVVLNISQYLSAIGCCLL